jgi:hypothetical protein
MKKLFLILMLITMTSVLFAQDVIYLKTFEERKGKVLDVGKSSIKYRKYENNKNCICTISIYDVLSIKYEDGTHDYFNIVLTKDNICCPWCDRKSELNNIFDTDMKIYKCDYCDHLFRIDWIQNKVETWISISSGRGSTGSQLPKEYKDCDCN